LLLFAQALSQVSLAPTSDAHRVWVMDSGIAGHGGGRITAGRQEPCDFELFCPALRRM
jgi:hypothetical protein